MAAGKEMVLYYCPRKREKNRLLKSVLIRMGIRIKNVTEEQVEERVGTLLGISGFALSEGEAEEKRELPAIPEEVLVLHNFTGRRLDELLAGLRRAKVPPIPLKAVVTQTNSGWSFYELYEEIQKEHEQMRGADVHQR